MFKPPEFKIVPERTVPANDVIYILDKLEAALCDICEDVDYLNVTTTKVSDGDGEKKIVVNYINTWIDFIRDTRKQLTNVRWY